MNREALQAYFRIGIFLFLASVLLLTIQRPDTAEYVVTVFSVCIGAALVLLVAFVARRT
jgi:hypothetical protein